MVARPRTVLPLDILLIAVESVLGWLVILRLCVRETYVGCGRCGWAGGQGSDSGERDVERENILSRFLLRRDIFHEISFITRERAP